MSSSTATIPSSLQQAWDSAQPQLSRIRESLAASTQPSPRTIRVGQLDAELLDQELVQLLKDPLVKALSLVNTTWRARFEPELVLLIQAILYKLSFWNLGTSYGARLQGLKYTYLGVPSTLLTASGLPCRVLLAHGSLTVLLPYIHTRIRAHALSQAWPDAPSSDKRRKAWELLTRLESTHSLLGFLNFIMFLWNGRYRTTLDRLLKLRLVSARRLARREVSYEFMNRQMVWHAFTEFLLFLLPLINTRALRRRLANFLSNLPSPVAILPSSIRSIAGLSAPTTQAEKRTRRGKYWALPLDQCAICAENASTNLSDPAGALQSRAAIPTYSTAVASSSEAATSSSTPVADVSGLDETPPAYPIHNPYVTACGHVYCYYCISERMMRAADERTGVGAGGRQWECLRCAEGVLAADRLQAQAEGPEYDSGAEDMHSSPEFGSEDIDYSEMSGSVGSYSESGLSE
ncbi:hypothetical protein DAEQUDRAFT_706999 [Daedalea quercina L-15889]|uniref:RING-type E3 ubiquitin transferase (cysteine targeting) n=1 Tax=Daedalea quercina L-15889 TaxID=1314783 RepID=A0A165S778_9APHY|nr:hypothetical protein DAEQUDRAFT_706999 [Daedalea quercina L-15889]